jgi:hypothetical protein
MSEKGTKEEGVRVADLPKQKSKDFLTTYANNVGSASSRYDVRLVFGQVTFGPGEEPYIEDRAAVTMCWEHVVALRDLLTRLISQYENKEGKIRTFDEEIPA